MPAPGRPSGSVVSGLCSPWPGHLPSGAGCWDCECTCNCHHGPGSTCARSARARSTGRTHGRYSCRRGFVAAACKALAMQFKRMLTCLAADYERMHQVVSGADLTAQVPSCPDWTVNDLVQHVGAVYLHKVECMRRNAS